MSLSLSLSKFIHVTVYETSFKKIIAPEQILLCQKCRAKQFLTQWNLLLFFPLPLFSVSLTAEYC